MFSYMDDAPTASYIGGTLTAQKVAHLLKTATGRAAVTCVACPDLTIRQLPTNPLISLVSTLSVGQSPPDNPTVVSLLLAQSYLAARRFPGCRRPAHWSGS